jgi:nicotinate-nucleotide adenylyltransferase
VSERLAVFGGSFDPPHVAHMLVAAYVLATEAVDRVLVVPTASHPFGKQLTSFEHRVQMCELAFSDLPEASVCTIERELPPPSLTLRMLEALAAQHPSAHLHLVIGSDLLAETHAWHNFERITQLAPPIIVERQGHERPNATTPALPMISSTEIRHRLPTGVSTHGYLSPAVASYALEYALYTTERPND